MPFINYFYVFLWAALAIMVIVVGFNEGFIAYVISSLFVFLTVWYGIHAFGGIEMFEGVLGFVFNCVLVAYLVVMILIILVRRRKRMRQ